MSKIMVHLNHPCREIDVAEIENDDEKYLRGQGYISLEELRNIQNELKNCQAAREDTYSIFDDTMNDIWGSIYPEEPKSWEYPGMVTRHVRAVIKELPESKQQNELYKRALMQCHADMGSRLPWDKWLEWMLKDVEEVIDEKN